MKGRNVSLQAILLGSSQRPTNSLHHLLKPSPATATRCGLHIKDCSPTPAPRHSTACVFSVASLSRPPLYTLMAHSLPLPFPKSSLFSLPPINPLYSRCTACCNYSGAHLAMGTTVPPHYIIFPNSKSFNKSTTWKVSNAGL